MSSITAQGLSHHPQISVGQHPSQTLGKHMAKLSDSFVVRIGSDGLCHPRVRSQPWLGLNPYSLQNASSLALRCHTGQADVPQVSIPAPPPQHSHCADHLIQPTQCPPQALRPQNGAEIKTHESNHTFHHHPWSVLVICLVSAARGSQVASGKPSLCCGLWLCHSPSG